jgi:outer membrane biosynthesis protein TonB
MHHLQRGLPNNKRKTERARTRDKQTNSQQTNKPSQTEPNQDNTKQNKTKQTTQNNRLADVLGSLQANAHHPQKGREGGHPMNQTFVV